jgi:hypothetical protein
MITLTALAYVFGVSHDQEVTRIAAAHAASVAAIQTLRCDFTHRDAVRGRTTGSYVRNGADYLLKVRHDKGLSVTALSQNGQSRSVSDQQVGPQRMTRGRIVAEDGDSRYDCDPYAYNLFRFYGPTKFREPLADILTGPCTSRYEGTVTHAGRPLQRVRVSHARADLTIDFDPSVNHLARVVTSKSKLAGAPDKPPPVQEVTEFTEVSPGVYYPTQVRCIVPATGDESWTYQFANVRVNQPVPPEALSLRFPARIHVMDKVRGGVYVTDAGGEPTAVARGSDGQPLTLGSGLSPGAVADEPEFPSSEEPPPQSRWVLPAAVALLVVGIGVRAAQVIRRRRGV